MGIRNQGVNPYLPSWEYVPDGEPYVFGDSVYIYGTHDRFGGYGYCMNDYVCWSASVDDLANWRYEGVIYGRTDDPLNKDNHTVLFAPDVTVGPDGRYYLYYALDTHSCISVAVCNEPAGRYEFYGYVHYKDGTILGERPGDEMQFDPGVLTEGDRTYLYTGFCPVGSRDRSGSRVTVLGPDMLTIEEEPVTVIPNEPHSQGTGFEGHEFFEASSIRKIGDTYYLIYSSIVFHELCYATSKYPNKDFKFGGVIVSNNDIGIRSYKPDSKPMYFGANNHGSIVEIQGQWYVFYHRHTNGINFCRQGCLEPIEILEDGSIPQVEMTSCGPNGGPLKGEGEYPAYIACNLMGKEECKYTGKQALWLDNRFPKITQWGKDGDQEDGFIANMRDGSIAGFKYFDCKGVKKIAVTVSGYANGELRLKLSWSGQPLCVIPTGKMYDWVTLTADVDIPDGVHALYFEYAAGSDFSLCFKSFTLITE